MMHTYEARYGQIIIRPLLEKDIEFLRIWRNDQVLSKYLKPIKKITPKMQLEWFNNYLQDNSILFFVIMDCIKYKPIGSLAIYEIDGNRAEVGKIVVDSISHGKGLGYLSLVMAMKIGYEKLGINYFVLNCHEDNNAAFKTYLKAGFVETGKHRFIKGGYEIEMAVNKYNFQKKNIILDEIKIDSDYGDFA